MHINNKIATTLLNIIPFAQSGWKKYGGIANTGSRKITKKPIL